MGYNRSGDLLKRLAPVLVGVTRKREYRTIRRMPSRLSTVVTVWVNSLG